MIDELPVPRKTEKPKPVCKVAIPAPLSGLLPNVNPPVNMKVTVPVGVPAADVTAAVYVTAWPKVDGFCEEANVVEVSAAVTACTSKFDVCVL
jgi:hypothetical protein